MKIPALLSLLACLITTPVLQAANVVSFNFEGNAAPGSSLLSSETAGVAPFAAANWNNLKSDWHGDPGAVPSPIVNSGGKSVGLTVQYDSGAVWSTNSGTSTPDYKLFKGYLDDAGTGSGQPYINIGNVNSLFQSYSVIVYLASDSANSGAVAQLGQYWIQNQQSDAGAVIFGSKIAPRLFGNSYAGTYGRASNTVAGNYLIFSGLTSNNFTIRADRSLAFARASIAGFQIIPEPGKSVLLLLASLPLILGRRRHSR